MNINQKNMFQLLSEITTVCARLEIPCFLSGRTAIRAYLGHTLFSKRLLDIEVTVPVWRVEELIEALRSNGIEDRTVEYVGNQAFFSDFSLRYINTSTTMLRFNDGASIHAAGFFVRIKLLRCFPGMSDSAEEALRLEHLLHETAPVGYVTGYTTDASEREKWEQARQNLGTAFTGEIFSRLVGLYSDRTAEKIAVTGLSHDLFCFDRERFETLMPIMCDGAAFYLPSDPESYFLQIAGENWMACADEWIGTGPGASMVQDGMMNIVSSVIPFEVFRTAMAQEKIDSDFYIKSQKKYESDQVHRTLYAEFDHAWMIGRRGGDLWMAYDHYLPVKEKIRRLFAIRQFDMLWDAFRQYDEAAHKYAAADMGWYFDDELWEIYQYMLRACGQTDFADKLKILAENDSDLWKQLKTMYQLAEEKA